MKTEKKIVAIDLGASSGRAMLGLFDGETIELKEIHRFSNDPVVMNGTMYWDVLRLLFEIKHSLSRVKEFGRIDSIGIDTWGVDFGLLDQDGRLMENPVHYRDSRTQGMLQKSLFYIEEEEFYSITGNQFMEINTAFQLLSLKENRKHLLERAETLLLMPDLLNYLLTGRKVSELSIASTTQLFDARQRTWSKKVIQSLGLPEQLFTEIVPSGSRIGLVSEELCRELEITASEVIAVAGHDTQCAMACVPAKEKDFIFLSCGTWSLLGTELDEPIINQISVQYNITNEGGYGNKVSFLKNMTGLWLIQESRRQWTREGREYSFNELEGLAQSAPALRSFIDTDAPEFAATGDIPGRIRDYCKRTGQLVPESVGEIVRCINESLAMKYRYSLEQIKVCTGKEYTTIYMVGGGVQSKMLCAMTASACQCKVSSGPVEATVLGNMIIQLMAKKAIASLEKAREIIRNSQDIIYYEPVDADDWENAYQRYKEFAFRR